MTSINNKYKLMFVQCLILNMLMVQTAQAVIGADCQTAQCDENECCGTASFAQTSVTKILCNTASANEYTDENRNVYTFACNAGKFVPNHASNLQALNFYGKSLLVLILSVFVSQVGCS